VFAFRSPPHTPHFLFDAASVNRLDLGNLDDALAR
jgi:hypothetical protein